MRYGTIPRGLKERIATLLGIVPYPMIDVLVAPLQARALIAAQRLSVFEALGERDASTEALAERLRLDASCLDLVLRLLSSMGYVKRRDDVWSFTRLGRRHFGPSAPHPFGDFVAFGAPQWDWISRLEEVMKSGEGVEIHRTLAGGDWNLYQRAMAEGARDFAAFVARELPVGIGATSCLDIAGSHGLVGAALCRAHPGLRSVVLERAEAIPEARKIAAAAGVLDVVSFRECDFLTGDLGKEADVAVLANILHHFPAAANLDILRRVRAALKTGGAIGVFDIEAPERNAAPEAAGDAAALFFRITSNGRCFSGADYANWLESAGFKEICIKRTVLLPSRLLVTARA